LFPIFQLWRPPYFLLLRAPRSPFLKPSFNPTPYFLNPPPPPPVTVLLRLVSPCSTGRKVSRRSIEQNIILRRLPLFFVRSPCKSPLVKSVLIVFFLTSCEHPLRRISPVAPVSFPLFPNLQIFWVKSLLVPPTAHISNFPPSFLRREARR